MGKVLPQIITFGLSFLMFGIAALQIFLGYALAGRSGHQKRVYMTDEPTKFWTIVAIPIVIGGITFLWGILLFINKKHQ